MKRVTLKDNWPESWKSSFQYDLLEIYGEQGNSGYSYAYANRRDQTLQMIAREVRYGSKILDLAAAQGNFSLLLAEKGYEVTWNDLREELADYVKLKHESGLIHYAPGNVYELTFKQNFDLVLLTEMIEHVAHPDDLLRHIFGFVRPGGYVVITTPNGGYFLNRLPKFSQCADPSIFEAEQFKPNADGHIFLLHTDEIKHLAQVAGFKVMQINLFTNPLTAGHLKSEALLRVLPGSVVKSGESLLSGLPLYLREKLSVSMAVLLQRPLD